MEVMILEGDGIGPEVMATAIKILGVLRDNFGLKMETISYDVGAKTLDTGKWDLPKILEEARNYRAILKAPMGDPALVGEFGTERALDIILGLRFNLDLYANVRPVKLIPGVNSILKGIDNYSAIDYTLIRENSEGLYSSHFGGMILRDSVAIDNQIVTREGTERIAKLAFEISRKSRGTASSGDKVVTCVDKSNVLKSFAFFRKVFQSVAERYPDIRTQYIYGDAMTQYMLFHPRDLNVIVTENMFGDILSDLGASTVGGLGFAYSANLSDERGMFEPVHGSAVDIAGKGIANPLAMMLSTGMMLEWLGFKEHKDRIEKAIFSAIESGAKTPDMGGNLSTNSFTDTIVSNLMKID